MSSSVEYLSKCTSFPSVFIVFVIYLYTGSTPLGCYKKLIEYYKKGEISFQYVKTFNMDEYVGTYSFLYALNIYCTLEEFWKAAISYKMLS